MKTWAQVVGSGLRRASLAFVVVAYVFGSLFVGVDGDDPLRSDDPYIVGFFCGAVASAMALLYTFVERFVANRDTVSAICFGILSAWCGSLLIARFVDPYGEGAGHLLFFAIASFHSGVIGWLLSRWRVPNRLAWVIGAAGIVMACLYITVAVRMTLAHS